MRYVAHVLNLIMSDWLKDMDNSVVQVRSVVRFMRSSSFRFQNFKIVVMGLQVSHATNVFVLIFLQDGT